MQRYDNGIRRRAGGGDERKELRCRNCTHVANFLSSSSFEQGKKANEPILEPCNNVLTGPFNALPILIICRCYSGCEHFIEPLAFNESSLRPYLRFLETLIRPVA